MKPEPEYPPLPREHAEFWRLRLEDPCFVYVIAFQRDGPIKVGRAKDPWTRAKELQIGNPYPLRVLHVLPGDHELEWQLHQRLKDSRLQGEWFHGPAIPAFLAFLEDLIAQMIAAETTDFHRFGEWLLQGKADVKVRFGTPMAAEELEQARARAAAVRAERHRRSLRDMPSFLRKAS